MKQVLLLFLSFCFYCTQLYSQANCANPAQVPICPGAYLSNQTNAGMGVDAPASCNVVGEDVVYEISAPNGAKKIYVSVVNASAAMSLSLQLTTCGSGACNSIDVPAGDTNVVFNVAYANLYYVWVAAPETVTFDISFGADTDSVYINNSNTQGNLQLDSSGCALPLFNANKPFFQVSYNSVYQTDPMTLSPLNTAGNICITTFFENTTGIEGVKKFEFDFDSLGYSGIVGPSDQPGNYNAGKWVVSNVGNDWTLTFNDSLGQGKGDFSGAPNTCLEYSFCFNLVPVSNDPVKTNVDIEVTSDGFGSPFTGYISTGCCPGPYADCLSGGSNPGSVPHGFAFSFDDPAGLPVQLIAFNAKAEANDVQLNWTTASEINNDYFTVEKSQTGYEWLTVNKLKGAGTSTHLLSYESLDKNPFTGTSYYRLKQTDFDGKFSYSSIKSVNVNDANSINVYPNPASTLITIEVNTNTSIEFTLYNAMGEKTQVPLIIQSDKWQLNTSQLPSGIYFLVIARNEEIINKTKVIIQN